MTETTRGPRPVPPPGRQARAAALALALALGPGAGCGREFFRNWADQDVSQAVFEKSRDPRWRLDMFSIEPPALSRFAHPYDPDRPPAPPDDRAAEALSPVPQWPHHRLIVPVEGTGYADMLETWLRQRPAPARTEPETVPDSGPSAVPLDQPPLPSDSPSPSEPESTLPEPLPPESDSPETNSGTNLPGMSPIIPGGNDNSPDLPPDRDAGAGAGPPQAHNITTNRQEPGVHLAALQLPTTPEAGEDPTPAPADAPSGTPMDVPGLEPVDPGPQVPTDPRLNLREESLQPTPEADVGDLTAILNPGPIPFDEVEASGLPRDSRPYIVTPEQALTLALINSRQYQLQLENVYVSGLNVTLQRFDFRPQFYAGLSPQTGTVAGFPRLNSNPGNSFTYRTRETGSPLSQLQIGTAAGFGKLLAFGTRVAGGFANQTIINFTGANARQPTVQSFLPLTVMQPFLRGGGRALTLEGLTQGERDLLYQVRNFARFRQQFMPNILAQVTGGAGTAVGGTAFADTGLGGLGAGDGTTGAADLTGFVAGGGTGGGNVGFLQVLLQLQIVENDAKNVAAFQRILTVFRTLAESPASGVAPLDIIQIESQLLQSRQQFLRDVNQYRSQLDQYKIQLGLPPDIPLTLDRSLIERFREVFNRIDRLTIKRVETLEEILQDLPVLEEVIIDGRGVLADIIRASELDAERRRVERRITQRADARDLVARLQEEVLDAADPVEAETIRALLREAEAALAELQPEADPKDRQEVERLVAAQDETDRQSVDRLEDLLLAGERVGLENRLDLMNVRAQLYDAWRQLAVRANLLKGIFDLTMTNQFQTPPTTTNPFGFNDQTKQFSLVLNAELPLVRLAERNNYIRAQIEYQRQRRAVMAAEDDLKRIVRQEIRTLQILSRQYEFQKANFIAALRQNDQSLQNIVAPPAAAGGAAGATGGGSNNQTLVLIQAQTRVSQLQNQLVQTWVQYQGQRLALYRDLGIIPYDEWEAFHELFPSANPRPVTPGGDARPAAPETSRAPQGLDAG